MKKIIEQLTYFIFGNFATYEHIRQINFLSKFLPDVFLNRDMVDLGCGDGVNTKRLAKMVKAKSISGYDKNPHLIRRAKIIKLLAEVKNIEEEILKGELGILWGVLHHLKEPANVLLKLKNEFDYIIIREKIKNIKKPFFELGEPFEKIELLKMLDDTFGKDKVKIVEFNNIIFGLYARNGIF